ncbi:MAG: hypothetical protein ACM31I_05715 [Deltaproteobacteria bacterium]
MRMPAGRFLAACVGAAMAAGLCGCAIIGQQCVLERQFTESQVEDIRKGETTKKEVLDRLGPPAAVARPGAGAADNVLRRFAATGKVGVPLIYRYDASALTWGNLCVYGEYGGGCIPSTPLLKEQKLWLLIDEKSGRVVDRILEETAREEGGAHVEPWPGP